MPIKMQSLRYIMDHELQVDEELVMPRDDSSDPATLAGAIRYNDVATVPEYFDGTNWVPWGGGGGGDIIIGTFTTTGDGFTIQFLIPHGLGVAPTKFIIDPTTPAAQGIYSTAADATNLIINYDVAPLGTLTYNYTIEP